MVSKKERILETIKNLREFKSCGPSDDPDEQTSVCVGYHYLVTQLQKMATPFIPESIGKSLSSIEVNMNNLYSVYEARAEIDALLPDIELIIQGLDESVFDRAKVCLDGVKSVAGKMIPTVGQFRKLGELFAKDAKKLPGLSHTIRPIEKSFMDVEIADGDEVMYIPSDDEIDEVEKAENNINCGMYYPFIAYDVYFTDKDVCVGYLIKPLIYGENANDKKSFADFSGLGESAGNLLRQIPNHLLSSVGAFCSLKKDSYDINLWLVFLHELEGNQLKENRRSEVKNVFLKSALACEWLADKLESSTQQIEIVPGGKTGAEIKLDWRFGEFFTDDERQLFTKVSNSVNKYPHMYKAAGEWLDGHDEKAFWFCRECEFKLSNGIRNRDIKLRAWQDLDEDTLKKYGKHADKLEKLLKNKKKPPLVSLLKDAWDNLETRYLVGYFLSDEDAKAAILITWLLTDPDANRAHLGLTKFENWNWGFEEVDLPLTEVRAGAIEHVWFKNRGIVEQKREDRKKVCINLIRHAWAKIEAEKPADTQPISGQQVKQTSMEREDVKLKTNHKALIKALSKALEEGNTTEITRDALVRKTNYAVGSGNINQAYIELKKWEIITQDGQNFTPHYQHYKQNPPD